MLYLWDRQAVHDSLLIKLPCKVRMETEMNSEMLTKACFLFTLASALCRLTPAASTPHFRTLLSIHARYQLKHRLFKCRVFYLDMTACFATVKLLIVLSTVLLPLHNLAFC